MCDKCEPHLDVRKLTFQERFRLQQLSIAAQEAGGQVWDGKSGILFPSKEWTRRMAEKVNGRGLPRRYGNA